MHCRLFLTTRRKAILKGADICDFVRGCFRVLTKLKSNDARNGKVAYSDTSQMTSDSAQGDVDIENSARGG